MCAFAILVIVGYWITEALPLPISALAPTMMMPLLGIVPAKSLCKLYMKVTYYHMVDVSLP